MNKTENSHHEELLAERRALLQELSALSLILRGSFFQRFSTCSRPRCQCHKGKKHGPRSYVTMRQQKKQKQFYIPQKQVQAVRQGIRQYQRLTDIINRISAINIILIREGIFHDTSQR